MTANLPVPEHFDPKAILDQFLEGKRTEEIAKQLGMTREKLVYLLTNKAPDDWKEAQVMRQIRRMEEAEEEIEDAEDMLQLNKANSKLKAAQWALERVCSRIYGDRQQPQSQAVQININLRRDGTEHNATYNGSWTKGAAEKAAQKAVEQTASPVQDAEVVEESKTEKAKRTVYVPLSPREEINYHDDGFV